MQNFFDRKRRPKQPGYSNVEKISSMSSFWRDRLGMILFENWWEFESMFIPTVSDDDAFEMLAADNWEDNIEVWIFAKT